MDAERIGVEETKDSLDGGEKVLFIDTRDQKAWERSTRKLPGAVRIPDEQIEQALDKLPRDRILVAYCA